MLFNSVEFLIFFPTVVILFYLLPQKFRWMLLLASSCFFYMWFIPRYIIILAVITTVDYVGARLIDKYRSNKKKAQLFLVITVCVNVAILGYFKYLGFFAETVNFFGHIFQLETIVLPEIMLPIGISFHTFQSMGYLIDVYRGDEKIERNFGIFSLFLLFFPQMVAGPIERAGNLLDQLKAKHYFTYANLSNGGRMMLWGMFKKVVVADNLSIFADKVFNDVHAQSGSGLLIGLLFFSFQIYCDFSGYSDIAIGAAQIMDIKLMKNFDTPYFSQSIAEFWRRWHISLSTWFRDYLYIPLGGNRVSKPRWCFNQLVTFGVSGIWHGASWTFFVWGILNGIYMVIGHFTKSVRRRIKSALRIDKIPVIPAFVSTIFTFAIVCFSWIFFRANSFADAFYVIKGIVSPAADYFAPLASSFTNIPLSRFYMSLIALGILFIGDFLSRRSDFRTMVGRAPMPVRIVSYSLLLAVIVLFGAFDNKSFIYFQF
ncbi:MAG: MBOAT family protein [Eubacteriales bacterium]